MTHLLIAAPWVIVLILLVALIYGQPAATVEARQSATAQVTEVARLRATLYALPTNTPRRPNL